MKNIRQKVFVGLSGGVDSAVSAALLLRQGYDVVGVFLRTWHPEHLSCTEPEDRRSAMRVAAHLGIPFTTLDLSDVYRLGVAEEMIEEYRKGRTPNPDVLCNRVVKFGAFYEFAVSEGGDFIATGHYARTECKNTKYKNQSADLKAESCHLKTSRDSEKDQSYFLWMLPSRILPRVRFPIGDLKKKEVRHLAGTFGLPNARRPDSQGICFLGEVPMETFLRRYLNLSEGPVLDEEGRVIGTHKGAPLYTVGQRHGFSVAHSEAGESARYVVAKDIAKNTVTVARTPVLTLGRELRISLRDCNWIGPVTPGSYRARFRYRQVLQNATLLRAGETSEVTLDASALPPLGQSLVLYDGERVLGGGIIDAVS